MADIGHGVGIAAPAERLYRARAITEGLSGWWTRDVHGVSQVGEKLEFYFGYPEPAAVHHCSTKWAYFLLGLKAGLEGGPATPCPEDMKISSWG